MAEPLIGRRTELQALARFVEAVPAGERAFLIEGDAGLGKTALLHDAARVARARGIRVLAARTAEAEAQMAFATIADLFTPTLDDTLPLLAPLQRRALEIALLLRESDGLPPDSQVLGVALVSVVRALAERGPVLVVLDDVQWVDASSAEVLRFTLRRLDGQPVGVLATVRGRPMRVPLDLDRGFASFERLALKPLSIGAIHQLLSERLSLNLPRPSLVRVHAAAGGNPLYALELGRGLIDGTIREERGVISLPESLESVVAGRLDALPARVQETLVAVAALAVPTVPLLESLSGSAVDDIERAHARGVLELDGDRIRFMHPLLAPASYSRMPLHRRRRLHRRLADLDVDVEERARHLAIAIVGADEEVAAALAAGAAHAHARGAALAAAELAELAVGATPPDAGELNRRRLQAADLCMNAGDAQRASRLLEAALGSSERGSLRAEALRHLGSVRWETDGFPAAKSLFDRALAEPGVELREKVEILCQLAWIAAAGGGGADGIRYADSALELAEREGEPRQLSASLAILAEVTFWRTGRIRRDVIDRAIMLGGAAGDDKGARATLARLLARADRYGEARAIWGGLIAEADERADPDAATFLMFLARMEVASGAWDRAVELCEEGIELARQTGREMVESLCRMVLAEVDAYRGQAEKARAEIPDLLRVARGVGYLGAAHRLTRALASLELACGDAGAASRVTSPLFAGVREFDEVLAQVAGSAAIEVLIALGELSDAARLLTLLEDCAAGADSRLDLLAARCRGLLLAAHGRHEPAIEVLKTGARNPDGSQNVNPLELARTLLALGTVQRRAQHKRAARETLELAARRFEQLGASVWAARARSELRRIGGRPGSEGALSETERRIVELVVAGHRNHEVAAELSLSPNTVAWNLSKIYRKLGVGSRTELAARTATHARQ